MKKIIIILLITITAITVQAQTQTFTQMFDSAFINVSKDDATIQQDLDIGLVTSTQMKINNVCDTTKIHSKLILAVGIEADDIIHTAIALRAGVTRIYGMGSFGYNYVDKFFAFGLIGIGTSFRLTNNFRLNMELRHAALFGINSGFFDVLGFWRNTLFQFRPVLNYRFAKHLEIFAGPNLNILVQTNDGGGGFANPAIDVKIPLNLYNKTFEKSILNVWIGIVGGIKFIK